MKDRYSDSARIGPGLSDPQASRSSNGTKITSVHALLRDSHTHPLISGQIWPDRAYLAHRPLLFRLLGIFIWDLIPAQNVVVQKTHRFSTGGPGFGPQTPAGLHRHLFLLKQFPVRVRPHTGRQPRERDDPGPQRH